MSKYSFKVTSPVWELVPPGDHVLKLTGVEDGPVFTNDKTGAPEPTTKLKLEVDRGPSKGLGLSALINPANCGPKSNARRWAQALAGRDLEDEEEFDPEAFVDTLVWAKVGVKPDSKGIDRNVVDTVFSYAALEAQFANGTRDAGPRPAAPPPAQGTYRVAPGLEAPPDRELELPEEAWDGLEPPPDEDGGAR